MSGRVYLIGAGPGDPDLITVKGLRCLQSADCVIYDYLVNSDLLEAVRPNAERIYVGKRGGIKQATQEEINRLIIEKAAAGKVVARLKGGDPFVFGRGGEEAEVLAERGIPFEIVPGVTSGYAAPAYAGIPVTHRDFSPSVAFVTGHEDPERAETGICWEKLSTGVETLVFFMGVSKLPEIVNQLLLHGRPPHTPVAFIQWGTYPRQEVLTGTLADIVSRVQSSGFSAPAITVVGEVVRLREKLNWFETLPLFGRRIVITRPREQADEFRHALSVLGAEVISLPTIEIRDPVSWDSMDEAIRKIERYSWLIFTSVNGVRYFFSRWALMKRDIRELHGILIGAIGSATEQTLRSFGVRVELVPDEYRAEGVVEALKGKVGPATRILIPRARVARDVLPESLRSWGIAVDVVEAYQTVVPEESRALLRQIMGERRVEMIVFTSSSSVTNLAELSQPDSLAELLKGTTVAAIGPVTAETARRQGLDVSVQPSRYDVPSLINSIRQHFEVTP